MCSLEEELSVLNAIYCKVGELTVDYNAPSGQVLLKIQFTTLSNEWLKCSFSVPYDYPASPPRVSLFDQNRDESAKLQNVLESFLKERDLLNQPMLAEVVDWAKERISTMQLETPGPAAVSGITNKTVLIQLDHMRNRTKYVKTLQTWAKKLLLQALIVFYKHLIFIILNGQESPVSQFLLQLRTQNVDVDSSGRPCKERMSKILLEQVDSPVVLKNFEVVELKSLDELLQTLRSTKCSPDVEMHIKLAYQA